MLTSKPWLDPTKILVQVKLNKAFPSKVPIKNESGSITMVDVLYSWLPSKCSNCGLLGHKASRCLGKLPPRQQDKPSTNADIASDDVSLSKPSPTFPLSDPDSSFKASVTTTGESVISIATSKSQAAIISTPEVIEFISAGSAADNAVNQSAIATSTKSVSTMISPPISHHDTCNESNVFEPVTSANVEDLISLATVTELENMYVSPTFICINEAVVSPSMESTRSLPITDTPIDQVPPAVQRESSGIARLVLGSNKFALLIYLEEEEEDPVSFTSETNSVDLMTPSGKRTLLERPVKPSAKAREMHFQFTGSGGGNRGRRGRGGGNG